jgi:NTP pyrophosphatase (non-canonical NTP hydrolase)
VSMFSIGSKRWPGISKLIEECGEVTQVCGKLMGLRGELAHWDGTNLRERLQDELGDLLAAISFVIHFCDLDDAAIQKRAYKKRALFEHWHTTNSDEAAS